MRVLVKEEPQIRAKLGAKKSQPRVQVQQIYEMRPLSHVTTRKGLAQVLSELGWAAKPVQPGRSDASGMSWKAGAEHQHQSSRPPLVKLRSRCRSR